MKTKFITKKTTTWTNHLSGKLVSNFSPCRSWCVCIPHPHSLHTLYLHITNILMKKITTIKVAVLSSNFTRYQNLVNAIPSCGLEMLPVLSCVACGCMMAVKRLMGRQQHQKANDTWQQYRTELSRVNKWNLKFFNCYWQGKYESWKDDNFVMRQFCLITLPALLFCYCYYELYTTFTESWSLCHVHHINWTCSSA